MPIEAKDWYEPSPDFTSFYQGDVVRDVPIIFLPDKISQWFILRPDPAEQKFLDDVLKGEMCRWFEAFPEGLPLEGKWQRGDHEEFVAAKAKRLTAMIVTQSCDIVQRSYYQVAPVYPESKQSKLEHLRENALNYTFFLPAFSPGISENCYADLSHITLVPKRYFPKNTVQEKLAARLTSLAMTKLQEQIASYFGRPFGFSSNDTAKIHADYACIHCFYSRGVSTVRPFEHDTKFEDCSICGQCRWLRIETQRSESATEPVVRTYNP
jgi:hypothetical protein